MNSKESERKAKTLTVHRPDDGIDPHVDRNSKEKEPKEQKLAVQKHHQKKKYKSSSKAKSHKKHEPEPRPLTTYIPDGGFDPHTKRTSGAREAMEEARAGHKHLSKIEKSCSRGAIHQEHVPELEPPRAFHRPDDGIEAHHHSRNLSSSKSKDGAPAVHRRGHRRHNAPSSAGRNINTEDSTMMAAAFGVHDPNPGFLTSDMRGKKAGKAPDVLETEQDFTIASSPGALCVPGPGSCPQSNVDVEDNVTTVDVDNPNQVGYTTGPSGEFLAVAETVTEPPMVTGVEAPDEEAIYQAALKGAKEGAKKGQRATNRKLYAVVAIVFVVIAIAVGVAIPLSSKSSNTTVTEVNIFNTVYETQYTTEVILVSSGLNGTLPTELFALTELTVLDLSDNNLSGTIPSDLANLPNLAQVDISDNQLTGSIPSEIGTMTQLAELSLDGNKDMKGPIPPEFSQLTSLSVLLLYGTDLSGSIPAILCALGGPSDYRIDCDEILCDCCTNAFLDACEVDSSTPIPTSSQTPVQTPAPSFTATVALDEDQYAHGQFIRVVFSDPSQLDRFDDVLIFPFDVADYENAPPTKSQSFGGGAGAGKDGVTSIRADFTQTGTFKLIVRTRNTKRVLAESLPFTVVESSATFVVSASQTQYIQGQTIRATFSDPSQLVVTDKVLVFPSNVTDYSGTPAVKDVFCGGHGAGNDGVSKVRVDFVETGTFKLIMQTDNKKVILAETLPFTVAESSATFVLSASQTQYIQGQTITASFSNPSQLVLTDKVLVFPSNVTDYSGTPAVKDVFCGGHGAGNDGVSKVRVDFVETGTFKLIMQIDNKKVILAESLPFTVVESSATFVLSASQTQYIQGQTITATFSNPSQLVLTDKVLVFPSNVTDYSGTPAVKDVFCGGHGAGNDGVSKVRVDFVETGTFKLIMQTDNKKLILSESLPFAVVESSATFVLDKFQYTQGEPVRATFSDPTQLETTDKVLVFASNVTDYTYTPSVKDVFCKGAGAGNDGVSKVRVDFVETGSFKLIMRTSNKKLILAESLPFTAVESSATFVVDKTQYTQGESIRATFSDPAQLETTDKVLVFPSNVSDYTYSPPVKDVFCNGAGAGKDGVSKVRVDFVETGLFKLIMRTNNKKLFLAESLPFTVTTSSATFLLDKTQYSQGESIRATFSDPTQLETTDKVLVFHAEVTDYTYTPAVKAQAFGGGAEAGKDGVTIIVIDFDEIGSFKLVIQLHSKLAIAESRSFGVASA